MGRTLVRWGIGLLGAALIVMGAGVAAVGGVVTTTLAGSDSLRTTAQTIEIPGCSSAIMEISDVRVDAGELDRIGAIADRSQATLSVTVRGDSMGSWLVGIADQRQVEDRLLGARYCLVEGTDAGWAATPITVAPDAPDARFSGVPGVWATVPDGQTVELPIPQSGSTVVVSGSDESSLDRLEVVGIWQVPGASSAGWIALTAGLITVAIGVGLLMLSIVGLRQRGRHEDAVPTGSSA